MVTFMNFAGLVISRLEQFVSFINRIVSEAPRLREFFQVWDTVPAIRDSAERKHAHDIRVVDRSRDFRLVLKQVHKFLIVCVFHPQDF